VWRGWADIVGSSHTGLTHVGIGLEERRAIRKKERTKERKGKKEKRGKKMSAVYEQLLTDTLFGQHTDEIRTQAGLKLCSTFSNFKNNGFQL
jgi:hypothetical protein